MAFIKITKKLKGFQKAAVKSVSDGPHPYEGPGEDVVRKIAEKNTADVLLKLYETAKTMEHFRNANK